MAVLGVVVLVIALGVDLPTLHDKRGLDAALRRRGRPHRRRRSTSSWSAGSGAGRRAGAGAAGARVSATPRPARPCASSGPSGSPGRSPTCSTSWPTRATTRSGARRCARWSSRPRSPATGAKYAVVHKPGTGTAASGKMEMTCTAFERPTSISWREDDGVDVFLVTYTLEELGDRCRLTQRSDALTRLVARAAAHLPRGASAGTWRSSSTG